MAAHQAPPSLGFSRQDHWSGLPFPSPADLPNPGIEPMSPVSPVSPELAGGYFITEPPEKFIISSVHKVIISSVQFSSVQLLSRVLLYVTPWTAACQASLSITKSQSLLKLMSTVSVMPSSHLILCLPLLLLPAILPSIRVFSNESPLRVRWPKYWSFSFSISPSNEH